jgi:hypothetical protein
VCVHQKRTKNQTFRTPRREEEENQLFNMKIAQKKEGIPEK